MSISGLVSDQQDLARTALLESVAEDHVGAFIDFSVTSDTADVTLATYNYSCTSPSYPGWYWSVVVVAIEGQDYCTVSDINLLPGAQALVPPAWTPWASRVEPGDLGVGDLLPPPENDPRLTAGFTGLDDVADDLEPLHPVQWERGLGREQILSESGLQSAVHRWMSGQTGPRSAMAKSAPAPCSSCGYLIPIGGSLGQAFGMCGNEFGAADGQIVAMSFGCGAHSSVVVAQATPVPVVDLVIDDIADAQDQEISEPAEPGEESTDTFAEEIENTELTGSGLADAEVDDNEFNPESIDTEAVIDEWDGELGQDSATDLDEE